MVGSLDAERVRILVHETDEAVGQLADGFAVFVRAPDDLVVDVGDVAYVGEVKAAGPQPALDHVEDDENARMTQMAVVIDGHATDVHANLTRLDGDKFLLFPHKGIVDFQHFRLTRALHAWSGA